MTTAARASA